MVDNQEFSLEELAKRASELDATHKGFSVQLAKLKEETEKYLADQKETEGKIVSIINDTETERINVYRTIQQIVKGKLSGKEMEAVANVLQLSDVHVTIDGKLVESYDSLDISLDAFKDDKGKILSLTHYQAIVHAEAQGLFLPSAALTGQLLVTAFEQKDRNYLAEKYVQQFKNTGVSHGWHAVNTIIPWDKRVVIHNPLASDFPANYATKLLNVGRQRGEISFDSSINELRDKELTEVLGNAEYVLFLSKVIGVHPSKLIPIAQYLGRTPRAWVPNNPKKADYTAGVFVGSGYGFDVDTYVSLDGSSPASGVRESR